MTQPKLHGVNLSPYVRKTRVALAEKGIDYDLIPVMPFGPSDEYLKISPLGKIPCYQEGDFTLPDSSAILAYLERKQPEPALYPSDPQQFARALWYEEYSDTRLTEACITAFIQRVIQKMMGKESDEAAVAKSLEEKVPAAFGYLENELADRDFLAGGGFSIADIAVGSILVNFAHGGETVDASRWPRLADYVSRVHGRPSFKALIEEEKAALPS